MSESTPMVSVVIPVLNDAEDLDKTLGALEQQTYPRDRMEIIVVDNGSTDSTVQVAQSYPEVCVLHETTHNNSPYSARNRGIEASSGEVIALLDSTCIPDPQWAEEGVKSLFSTNSDIVGGEVVFWFPQGGRAAEVLDSLINVRMEYMICEMNTAPTANLIVRRCVFDVIGLFRNGVRSGEDLGWTSRATAAGLKLSFAPEAVVNKKARGLRELLRKTWRVSGGAARSHHEKGTSRSYRLSLIRHLVLPPNVFALLRMVQVNKRRGRHTKASLLALYCMLCLVQKITAVGGLYHSMTVAGHE